tara:strand:- start:9534 stop:9692 length:159 start_codon:yes stop_codon:yes gene_type:complete
MVLKLALKFKGLFKANEAKRGEVMPNFQRIFNFFEKTPSKTKSHEPKSRFLF